MGWDDLEPGQDDLVREDRLGKGFFRRAKNISLSTVSAEEALYTDHNAGDPSSLTPPAEKDSSVERRSGSPVRASMFQRMKAAFQRRTKASDGDDAFPKRSRQNKGYRGD